MKRISFLNRYFYPDHSATSQILSDLAFHLAASGRPVRVITSQQRYDDPNAKLPFHEIFNGVEVNRLATTQFGRSIPCSPPANICARTRASCSCSSAAGTA